VSSNLDLIRSIYADWERGDWSSADWADPEIEFEMVGGVVDGATKGKEEMGRAWVTMLNAWDDFKAVPEEFRELDDGRILVLIRNQGRGKGSGIDVSEITPRSVNVWTIREGTVVRLTAYWGLEHVPEELDLGS
jgi:ketosteroid isomerase-like protein